MIKLSSFHPLSFATVGLHLLLTVGVADNWPTFQHDNRRSGVTTEALRMPLNLQWTWKSPLPPQTAWTSPAKWDAYSGNEELQSMRNFDPCFYVTAVDDLVFFGSSVDDAAHALDAATGDSRWVYHTDSAVRLPPTWHDEKVYFGSDDGYAYAVEAKTGSLVWKHTPVPDARRIPSNGKLISPWPCRTGVLISEGKAYFGASLLPWNSSYLCAVSLEDGSPSYISEDTEVTLQGALLSSGRELFVPQGRSAPLRYAKADGQKLGQIEGAGGIFCLITEDEQFVAGPGSQKSAEPLIGIIDPMSQRSIVSFAGTNRILIRGAMAYVHQGNDLIAVERIKLTGLQQEQAELNNRLGESRKEIQSLSQEKQSERLDELEKVIERDELRLGELDKEVLACCLWRVSHEVPIGFMLAGDVLFTGSDGKITALNALTGEEIWESTVEGKAYGLAAAQGRLFVSTDRGHIYAFAAPKGS